MATSGEGGAGGKFRKRPFRRPQTTPYSRPPTSIRNPNNNSKGWLSKLVDPASKIIMTSAQMFFSSILRKRLPPPPPPQLPYPQPEANQEPRDRFQEAVPSNYTGACQTTIDQGGNLNKCSDGNTILDLEQLLKQKTFTRSESDSLMALLRSRTVELPVGDEQRTETSLSKPPPDLERNEGFTHTQVQENRKEADRFNGIISSPIVSSRALQENVASPAELAKSYMGSRPSKGSPSMLGSNNQAPREDATLINSPSLTSKSPSMLHASKTAHTGVHENGFFNPRSRGRSAIYSMARSPYFRVPPDAQKGTGFMNDGFGGPSSSQLYKQVALKRISSALDDDVGSVGAIRRVRQKPNLSSQGNFGNGNRLNAFQHHISSPQKLLLPDEAKYKASKAVEENGDDIFLNTNSVRFPSKSSEMGTKILQHLEKLTPKEKSSESKLVGAREKSPTKLTSNMLSGQALRSLEHVGPSKFMQNALDSHNSEDSPKNAHDSQEKSTVIENGPKMSAAPLEMLTSSLNADTKASVKDTVLNVRSVDINISKLEAHPPQKRRAFQMSALEDFVEMDDDICSDEPGFAILVEQREKVDKSVVEIKNVHTESSQVDKTPALPEVKLTAGTLLNKRTDFDSCVGAVVCEEKSGFTFSATSSVTSTTFRTTDHSESILDADKSQPAKDPNASLPLFSFNSKNVDKVPSFTFSSSPVVNESSGTKPGSPSTPKLESSNSLGNVALGTTDTQPKIPESDKDYNNSTQNGGYTNGTSENKLSTTSTSPSTNANFSINALDKNSNLNSGSPLSSTPSIFCSNVPVLDSSNSSDQTFNNSFTEVVSSTSTPTITSTAAFATVTAAAAATITNSTSAVPSIAAAPIFSVGSSTATTAPIFSFGSSMASATVSTTCGAETTDSKAKTENKMTFGNENGSPFTSFAVTSAGTSPFGFSSSVTNPMANDQSAPVFGTESGSQVSTQPSSFGTGNSLFSSSISAPKLFSSGSSFGLSSSTSSSEITSVSSSSGPTSITFASSWQQPNKPPLFASTFSSPNLSTGFSFGASPTSTATSNAPAMVFGSSTSASSGPVFSFGSAPTTSLSTPSQPPPVFGSSAPVFTAGSTNNDQMSMEDSMAEDPVQGSTPVFGQQPIFSSPAAGFMLGSTAPSPSNSIPFQFGGQQSQLAPQNPSPFQATSSLEFNAGGSFSLGSGGGDKSARRTVRVSKSRNRRKG
ncbi:hypothetical protein LguiA_031889 [Lonicera macranthoides]